MTQEAAWAIWATVAFLLCVTCAISSIDLDPKSKAWRCLFAITVIWTAPVLIRAFLMVLAA